METTGYKFAEGDSLLCYYGDMLYAVKCLKRKKENGEHFYYVHYKMWKSRYDEWVDESRILLQNEENMSILESKKAELCKLNRNKKKAKNAVKPIRNKVKNQAKIRAKKNKCNNELNETLRDVVTMLSPVTNRKEKVGKIPKNIVAPKIGKHNTEIFPELDETVNIPSAPKQKKRSDKPNIITPEVKIEPIDPDIQILNIQPLTEQTKETPNQPNVITSEVKIEPLDPDVQILNILYLTEQTKKKTNQPNIITPEVKIESIDPDIRVKNIRSLTEPTKNETIGSRSVIRQDLNSNGKEHLDNLNADYMNCMPSTSNGLPRKIHSHSEYGKAGSSAIKDKKEEPVCKSTPVTEMLPESNKVSPKTRNGGIGQQKSAEPKISAPRRGRKRKFSVKTSKSTINLESKQPAPVMLLDCIDLTLEEEEEEKVPAKDLTLHEECKNINFNFYLNGKSLTHSIRTVNVHNIQK